ncbi:unnamed protein product [Adineta ricciae]|uniref:Uncharacterized protein n=1 Tax=Adineta ricciae TaxID=249248 RepID=A0A815K3N4_ADIRI|nr:unnamed protein product [Adineta ricciae]CAF1388109.1 unnamed protein product [Adineta ricciae]
MAHLIVYCVILTIISVNCRQIPHINNVFLQPGYTSNSTTISNQTLSQCLCVSSLSCPAVNWFPNGTCQVFYSFPPTYRIRSMTAARLYFPQKTYPNASLCCMPDINYLLNKLQSASVTLANISNPRDMLIDDSGYLVTVEMSLNYLHRFNATDLTSISRTAIPGYYQMTVAYDQGVFYSTPNAGVLMNAINSTTLAPVSNISMALIKDPRGILFLDKSQTMMITSNKNQSLLFFNRTSIAPPQYIYTYSQVVNNLSPHGVWYVNDSYFYVTSYAQKLVFGYSKNTTTGQWNEALIVNASMLTTSGGSTNIVIDECGRLWVPQETNTVYIFDQQGVLVGNYTIPGLAVSFMKIVDNYIMYLSDCANNQIMRVNPNIQC